MYSNYMGLFFVLFSFFYRFFLYFLFVFFFVSFLYFLFVFILFVCFWLLLFLLGFLKFSFYILKVRKRKVKVARCSRGQQPQIIGRREVGKQPFKKRFFHASYPPENIHFLSCKGVKILPGYQSSKIRENGFCQAKRLYERGVILPHHHVKMYHIHEGFIAKTNFFNEEDKYY